MRTAKDGYGRQWIIEHACPIVEKYYGSLTIRQLYYRLVATGMPNDKRHYDRVVSAMKAARWRGIIGMPAFIDREREMPHHTEADEKDLDFEIEAAKTQIDSWMDDYQLERWSNQPHYVEVWIEKKALQGVFEEPCRKKSVGLAPCKGYPSLTFLYEAVERFQEVYNNDKDIVLLYFGDYDPSGADIPRSIRKNLAKMGCVVHVERVALNPDLITELGLPGKPPKKTDTRTANWNGKSAVELDAVEPEMLKRICKEAISKYFDDNLYEELKEEEQEERKLYQEALKEYVKEL